MSWWQSMSLGFLAAALAGLRAAIQDPKNLAKYRSYCLMVVQAAAVMKPLWPNDPDFQI